jgi:anion-transporting  ArsA/GET3 family ATPase
MTGVPISDPPTNPAVPGTHDPIGLLLDTHAVVVCTGAGGVGKTTSAATIALEAARRGRRACVVTIDPARRLADAMGLDADTARGSEAMRVAGPWPGELWAVMLDTRATFANLIRTYAPSPRQAQTILDNTFFKNIADALSGTHEYMAMEKLYELHNDDRFDIVIVDTPPTTNALDFLDAPNRITRFLDHRLYKMLVTPSRGLARAVNLAAQTFLRSISRVVGATVVDDVIEFFANFEGMEDGFRARAVAVRQLLAADVTTFVLVTVPRRDIAEEATAFVTDLGAAGISVDALIVNRVHPRFLDGDVVELRAQLDAFATTPLAPFAAALLDSMEISTTELNHLASLTAALPAAPNVRVPFLDSDVHDLAGLELLTSHIFRS